MIGVTAVCCTAWCQRHCGFQGASKVIVIHLLMLHACVSVCAFRSNSPSSGCLCESPPASPCVFLPVTVVAEFVVAGKGN